MGGPPAAAGLAAAPLPSFLHRNDILFVAAQQCDLAGLQATWEVLQTRINSGRDDAPALDQAVLDGGSASGDAVAKMEWVLEAGRGRCSLRGSTAEAAARSGDLGRLRWLRDRGCPMGGQHAVLAAMQHADLAVAQWLVDEAGCGLPGGAASSAGRWLGLLRTAACSCDAVARWQWLQERGAPPLGAHGTWVSELCGAAASAGQLEVVRYLLSSFGPGAVLQPDSQLLELQAAGSRCVPLMELLHQSGLSLSYESYICAAQAGDLAMVRWLVREAGVSAAELQLQNVIELWGKGTRASGSLRQRSRDLPEAVQLLVREAGCSGWGAVDDGGGGDGGGGGGSGDGDDDGGYGDDGNGDDGGGDGMGYDGDYGGSGGDGGNDGGNDGGDAGDGGDGNGDDGGDGGDDVSDDDMGGEDNLLGAAMRWCGLALVQYLLQQQPGYQPRRMGLVAAAGFGCEALLEWLAEHHPGCLADQLFADSPYVVPAVNGDRGTLTALRRLGVSWGATDVVVRAVRRGCPVPALRWLVEQGAPAGGARAMEAAVAGSGCYRSKERAWLRGLAAANWG